MASSLSNRMSIPRPDPLPPALPELPRSLSRPLLTSMPAESPSPFMIRTVRQADLAALSEVLASSFHRSEGWLRWFYPLLKTGIYEDLRSRLHSRGEHYACLVAVSPGLKEPILKSAGAQPAALSLLSGSDQILGSVEITLKTPSLLQPWNQKYLYLSNLAVQAEYRRQGVAGQLLQLCDRIALDWGFSDLYLHVLENNHAARRLYQKAGYQVRRIEANPLSLMLGQSRQLFLHKQLSLTASNSSAASLSATEM